MSAYGIREMLATHVLAVVNDNAGVAIPRLQHEDDHRALHLYLLADLSVGVHELVEQLKHGRTDVTVSIENLTDRIERLGAGPGGIASLNAGGGVRRRSAPEGTGS